MPQVASGTTLMASKLPSSITLLITDAIDRGISRSCWWPLPRVVFMVRGGLCAWRPSRLSHRHGFERGHKRCGLHQGAEQASPQRAQGLGG